MKIFSRLHAIALVKKYIFWFHQKIKGISEHYRRCRKNKLWSPLVLILIACYSLFFKNETEHRRLGRNVCHFLPLRPAHGAPLRLRGQGGQAGQGQARQ